MMVRVDRALRLVACAALAPAAHAGAGPRQRPARAPQPVHGSVAAADLTRGALDLEPSDRDVMDGRQ